MSMQAREPEVVYEGGDFLVVQDPPSGRTDEATLNLIREQENAWERDYESRSRGLQPSEAARPPRRPNLGRGAALLQSLVKVGMWPVVGASNTPNPTVDDSSKRDVLAPESVVSSPEGNEHNGLGRATR